MRFGKHRPDLVQHPDRLVAIVRDHELHAPLRAVQLRFDSLQKRRYAHPRLCADRNGFLAFRRDRFGKITLVVHLDARRIARAEALKYLLRHAHLHLIIRAACVDDVQDQIGVAYLLERGTERLHKVMRKLVDKADRIGQQARRSVRKRDAAHDGVERGKQLVFGKHIAVRKHVQKRALARVRIADERRDRRFALFPDGAAYPALFFDFFELLFEFVDPAANAAPVDLELLLAGTAHADAGSALSGHRHADAEKPRQAVFELAEFDLQLTLARGRAGGEDIEDQHRAVDDRRAQNALQIADLDRRQLVVKDEYIRFRRAADQSKLIRLAGADVGAVVDRALALPFDVHDVDARRFRKRFQLLQRIVTVVIVDADQHSAFRLRLRDGVRRRFQTVVRFDQRVQKRVLRQSVCAHRSVDHGLALLALHLADERDIH